MKGFKTKGSKTVHIMKNETTTVCGINISTKNGTEENTDGLLCGADLPFKERGKHNTLCSRCNMWAHYAEWK